MKKFIALLALVLVSASTMMYAQESNAAARRAERKAQRDAERAKLRAEEQVQDMAAYQQAVQALKNKQFVLEANQVIFRNGMSAFVTSNTNFVLMNGNRATVQTAFNTPYPGPNGIGGVTVDGNSSDMKMNVDKKGNVNCSFSVQGISFRLTNPTSSKDVPGNRDTRILEQLRYKSRKMRTFVAEFF